jgi:heterotetrameric sarcosine oxidase gamma subunit
LSILKEHISVFDRGLFWSPVPDWPQAVIEGPGISIHPVPPAASMCLVSGNLEAFLERQGLRRCLGPRDICDGPRYALRLAPDRMLFICNGSLPAEASNPSWTSDGIAVSDVTDGFMCFDLVGRGAADIMRLAASYDFDEPLRPIEESTLMEFAGIKAAVVRRETGWRLHVERPQAATLWHWLEKVS